MLLGISVHLRALRTLRNVKFIVWRAYLLNQRSCKSRFHIVNVHILLQLLRITHEFLVVNTVWIWAGLQVQNGLSDTLSHWPSTVHDVEWVSQFHRQRVDARSQTENADVQTDIRVFQFCAVVPPPRLQSAGEVPRCLWGLELGPTPKAHRA